VAEGEEIGGGKTGDPLRRKALRFPTLIKKIFRRENEGVNELVWERIANGLVGPAAI